MARRLFSMSSRVIGSFVRAGYADQQRDEVRHDRPHAVEHVVTDVLQQAEHAEHEQHDADGQARRPHDAVADPLPQPLEVVDRLLLGVRLDQLDGVGDLARRVRRDRALLRQHGGCS
jgi:hypothetical protein